MIDLLGVGQQGTGGDAAALAQRHPELFVQALPVTSPPAPSGSPAGGLPPRGQTPTAGSAGLDMARRRGYITT